MISPLIKFLMMFWAPKPTPMARVPPRTAKTESGMRARLRSRTIKGERETDHRPATYHRGKLMADLEPAHQLALNEAGNSCQ
jgi:hypothetical protein